MKLAATDSKERRPANLRCKEIRRPWRCAAAAALGVMGLLAARGVQADEALVAVAANFAEPARALAAAFSRESGQEVHVSVGSTGALYAQISHGAPFDAFLAASEREPRQLAAAGLALPETRFTYAVGTLVVWSADPARIRGDCAALLKGGEYRHVAIANPMLAPYGAAAKAALRAWGLWEDIGPKLLQAENVGQVFEFAATGNAELGFIARAQVRGLSKSAAGSYCTVDPGIYPPLRQQAVLLHHGEHNTAARLFLRFLQEASGVAIIRDFDYQAGAP